MPTPDVDAAAILLTTSRSLAEQVVSEVESQLADLPTADVAKVKELLLK